MGIKPVLQSFIMADLVIREDGTNKWSAIGIFTKLFCPTFPTMHYSMALYFHFSNVLEGEYDIKIEFTDNNGHVLGSFSGVKMAVHDRLSPVEFGIQTRMLPIPAEGKYDFKLFFNDEIVASVPLVAEKINLQGLPQ